MAEPLFTDSDVRDETRVQEDVAQIVAANNMAWAAPKAARVTIAPSALEWGLKSAPPPAKSLWHRVQNVVFYTASIKNLGEESALFRVAIESDAPAWNPQWLQLWPQKSGSATRGADETSWLVELEAGASATFRVEIEARLDDSARTGDFAWELVAYQAKVRAYEESGELGDAEPERRAGGALALLRLQHPDSRLLSLLPAIYQEAMLELRRQSDARVQDWEEAIATPLEDMARLPTPSPLAAQTNALAMRLRPLGNVEAPFFERFLLGFEDANEQLLAQVGELFRLFDPRETPVDFLPWLSQWVGLAFDGAWPELQRRQLLLNALKIYAWRGTSKGLAELIELFTGFKPEISDEPTQGLVMGQARLGNAGDEPTVSRGQAPARKNESARLGGLTRHTFSVTLSVPAPNLIDRDALINLIESQKPAHTAFSLHISRSFTSSPPAANDPSTNPYNNPMPSTVDAS